MVLRQESTGTLDEFTGTVIAADLEVNDHERKQYHIKIDAEDVEIKGATGYLHEWVGMSPKATEKSVPQGSVMDRYLTQIEICVSAAKTVETVEEAFALMVGKKFKFKRIKLGKDFEGHAAKDYIVPVSLAE